MREVYRVGAHDYLLIGGLLRFAAVVDALIVLGMSASFSRERRLRAAGGHVPLAYSVRTLHKGIVVVVVPGLAVDGRNATLAHRATEVAAAIAHRGIAGFVQDTAR